jgi:hypothetical protein
MSKTSDPLDLRDPHNQDNWELCCKFCGMAWPKTATMADTLPHFKEKHPGRRYEFVNRWVGAGKAPGRAPRWVRKKNGAAK